jgi:glycerol-3-phosphate acyltransferase PlsX
MGGDFAPRAVVEGVVLSADDLGADVMLAGDEAQIRHELTRNGAQKAKIAIEPAVQVVDMHESPAKALRYMKDSSASVAVGLVQRGEADAVVSMGNTGAFMAFAHRQLGTVEGVDRAAIALVLPGSSGNTVLLDAGANVDCRPEMLRQFALLGSAYAEAVLGDSSPRVGLLSVGEEETKGSDAVRKAHALLKESPINFVGNVEGNHIFDGVADVVVCDGFVGNIVLKVAEGMAALCFQSLREQLQRSVMTRLGALLARPALLALKDQGDYSAYGGALLLGVNGVCVVGHGRSTPRAVTRALHVAKQSAESGVLEHIRQRCAAAPAVA